MIELFWPSAQPDPVPAPAQTAAIAPAKPAAVRAAPIPMPFLGRSG